MDVYRIYRLELVNLFCSECSHYFCQKTLPNYVKQVTLFADSTFEDGQTEINIYF